LCKNHKAHHAHLRRISPFAGQKTPACRRHGAFAPCCSCTGPLPASGVNMKRIIVFLFLIISIYSQTNKNIDPEDVIIQYLETGERKVTIINRDELSQDLDSLHNIFLSENEEKLTLNADSVYLTKHIIGKWIISSIKRSNGNDYNSFVSAKEYYFEEDGRFFEIFDDDTSTGKWEFKNPSVGEITFELDQPRYMITNKEVLKYFDEEVLKSITIKSGFKRIYKLDKSVLTFFTFIYVSMMDAASINRVMSL
jgi:hypothetical protein